MLALKDVVSKRNMKKMDSLWHVECGLEATHYCGKHAKFYLPKMEQKQKSNWINRSEMKFRMNGLKCGRLFIAHLPLQLPFDFPLADWETKRSRNLEHGKSG